MAEGGCPESTVLPPGSGQSLDSVVPACLHGPGCLHPLHLWPQSWGPLITEQVYDPLLVLLVLINILQGFLEVGAAAGRGGQQNDADPVVGVGQ